MNLERVRCAVGHEFEHKSDDGSMQWTLAVKININCLLSVIE